MGLVKSGLQRARHQIKRLAQGAYAARLLRKADENGKAERQRALRFAASQRLALLKSTSLRRICLLRIACAERLKKETDAGSTKDAASRPLSSDHPPKAPFFRITLQDDLKKAPTE